MKKIKIQKIQKKILDQKHNGFKNGDRQKFRNDGLLDL